MFKTSKAAAALATALFAPATWAQDALPSGDDSVAELPSVTVTARKREESLQTVPISMRVLDGSAIRLDSAPGNSNAGLARAVPNVSFADTGGQYGNLFVIRGVGAFAPLSADDTSVVMYFDEVPRSVYGTPPTLMDVDRVEVLRGPQGTLFGRNTQGGAINVIPNAPEFKRAFSVTAEGGSHGYGLGELMANTPVSDSVAARLVMRYSSQDGTIPNVAAGGKDGGTQVGAARASVLWLAGDNTAVTFTGFYDRRDSDAPRFLWYQNPDFPQSAANPAGNIRWRDSGLSMRIEHDMASVKLTSLSSYQANDSRQPFDLTDGLIYSAMTGRQRSLYDQAYADFADIHFREKTFQQELRLSSLEDGRFSWTAGLNFFHSRFDNDTDTVASPAAFNFQAQNGQQKNRLSSSSLAAFGEGTLALTDKLKTTLGLRYTRERKHADYEFTGNGNPAVVAYSQHDMRMTDGFLTGRAGLSYEWTPDLMGYATVSRGAVAGGYPVTQTNGQTGKAEVPYERSTSWTYEAGVKSMWLERRLAVNASVFFNDVKNGHLIVFDPAQALFTTASLDYQSKGLELETEASLSSSLKLTAGIGYTHAELVDVPSGSSTGARNGNRVPNMPKINGSLALRYNAPMQIGAAQGRLKADLAWQYVGKRAVDVKESFELPGYGVVNARLGWQQNNWEVYAFAWNLFDKQYLVAGQAWTANVSSVRLGQPRIVGVGTTIRF